MDFIQQIKLKDVAANDDAILFKVNVNGEDRIFIGKQNTKFDIDVADNLESQLLSDKLSANLKLSESFQKTYLVDRNVMNKENQKKDVIVPCAVSKDIVQLGNLLYSLSTETNNNVLYLLYKNRLINRYVDDITHMIYYELNDDIKSALSGLTPNEILQGSESNINGFYGLIDNFNASITLSQDVNIKPNGTIDIMAIEKAIKYNNMNGYLEGLEDFLNVTNKEHEMSFNLIYEYGEDRQYENEQSNVYIDFIHLKNSLSPFFNVEVIDDEDIIENDVVKYKKNAFKLWRKYVKVCSSNFKLWTSYSLETPKTVDYVTNPNISILNIGNNDGKSPIGTYYNNIELFARTEPDYRLDEDLSHEGFTIHIDCPRNQILSRYMFSFNNRSAALRNADENYLTQTTQNFANWLIEKSKGRIQYKRNSSSGIVEYPAATEFTINFIRSLNGNDDIIELECIKDLDSPHFNIVDDLNYDLPPYVNAFNFNYDKGQIYRDGYDAFIDFKPTSTQYKSQNGESGKDFVIEYAELSPDGSAYIPRSITGNVYNWVDIENNITESYKSDAFSLHYSDKNIDVFDKKNIYNPDLPESSRSVNSKDYVKKTSWTMSLIDDSELQFSWIKSALFDIGYKNGDTYEKLTNTEWTDLLNNEIPKKDVIEVEIFVHEEADSFKPFDELTVAGKIKYILTKLIGNYDTFYEFGPGIILSGETFPDIKNVFLCESVGTSIEDAIACLYYNINKNGTWKAGDKVRFTNYRISQYETKLSETDSVSNETYYYLKTATGPSIKYFATPFDIRLALNENNKSDLPLTSPNYNYSFIDLFGLSINGKYVKDYNILESNIVSYLLRDKSAITSIDLTVAFKNVYGDDALCVNTIINGQLINHSEYIPASREYIEFVEKLKEIKSIKNLRFWCYGENGYTNNNFIGTYPFEFTNISMWNYPLELSQCQLLRRMVLSKHSLDNIVNDLYKSVSYGTTFISVDKDTDETGLYGKLFNMNSYEIKYEYAFSDPNTPVYNKKLYKIQDFEFIDRINGLNKLSPTSGRKSNLYSVKISNTGLAIEDDDDNETKNFKQTMNSALISAVNTICSKTEPLNTKLYSVIIES